MMKRLSFIQHLLLGFMMTIPLAACNEEDFEEKYGNGSPLASNVIPQEGFIYEYDNEGFVTKISSVTTETDDEGNEQIIIEDVADISYPQDNRAVMDYDDGFKTTYVFAFGENHYANRIIEIDQDGETYLTKVSYDSEGHVTSFNPPEEELRLEWTDGNLTRIEQDDHNASTVITYTSLTNFSYYKMSPYLLDVDMGPFMHSLGWWFDRGLSHALYLGFLGQHSVNLPASRTSYDDENPEPDYRTFNYRDTSIGGFWD